MTSSRTTTLLASLTASFLAGLAVMVLGAGNARAANCPALPATKGTATLSVNVPEASTYRVWARIKTPNANAGRFYLQVPDAGACQVSVGGGAVVANQFVWVDYQNADAAIKIDLTLAAGSHGVILAGQDPSVAVDKLLMLSDKACVPTEDGSNCTKAVASTASPEAGAALDGATVEVGDPGATVAPQKVKGVFTIETNLPEGATDIKYYVDGKLAGPTIDTTNLPNGLHTIRVTAKGPDGKAIVQESQILVENPAPSGGQFTAGLAQTQTALIGGVAGLLALLVGGYLFYRHRHHPVAAVSLAGIQVPAKTVSPSVEPTTTPAGPPGSAVPGTQEASSDKFR